jgi:tryptophanyl-tRNA synthetase
MITDPARVRKSDPGHPDVCAVNAFHKHFSGADYQNLRESCQKGEIGCVACKKLLADRMSEALTPIYERRQEFLQRPRYIREILASGAQRARREAERTMAIVREAMRLW